MDISWIKNIFERFTLIFDFKRTNSPTTKVVTKIGTVTTNISQATIHQGLSYTETKELIESVVDQKLISFHNEAKEEYYFRRNTFKNLLIDHISALSSDEIEKLKEPDTQIAIIEAANIAGRKQDPILKKLLANLVINRIKHDKSGKEELKNIVFNEAIFTVNKLTIDQIKIITLCYVTRYLAASTIDTKEKFCNLIDELHGPFLDFKGTSTDFSHIEYTGCGKIGAKLVYGHCHLLPIFSQRYPAIFTNHIKREQIDGLNLDESFKNKIVKLTDTETDYQVVFKTPEQLQEYFNEYHICDDTKARLSNLFYAHRKTDEEIINIIKNDTTNGNKLIEIWTNSRITTLSLTSVGIAIGACYFEQITSQNIDIDIWIN